jgi:hypothetical protein
VRLYSTTHATVQPIEAGLRGCAGAHFGGSPSPLSARPAGEGCRECLSEATDGIAVALKYAEAMSGFVKARRPTEGKEEGTEAMNACRPCCRASRNAARLLLAARQNPVDERLARR